jgi:hypothetical protein
MTTSDPGVTEWQVEGDAAAEVAAEGQVDHAVNLSGAGTGRPVAWS